MENIKVEKLSKQELEKKGVFGWPVWKKKASDFDWHYDTREQCYFLSGRVTVVPSGGGPVRIGAGDFVTFPQGLSCTWKISQDVEKHYNFG